MGAAKTERLVAIAQAARCAGHGKKGEIYDAACVELGMSRQTLMRKLKEVSVTAARKRRCDAGRTSLGRDEAAQISAALVESTRKNGKRLLAVGDATQILRYNSMVRAESVNPATGEIRPLSESTIHRALRTYRLHPDQLTAPAPVTELASRHPNHVWQIDASLCVLYYLRNGSKGGSGLQVMPVDQFNKNKPKNLARIAADRVWSYEITDHTSGWIYVQYVMGAESGENLCSVLIDAMQERGGADVMHGVPKILMLDAGSANTAAMTKNLCRSLGIEMIVHAPGNARATGSVEKARDIIERSFEPGLKFQPVEDLDALNEAARKWRMHHNFTARHSRHGKTRSALWMTITADQLIKAPSVEVCRALAVASPVSRVVTPKLRVPFGGREYDVSTVPNVIVGEKLMVTRNPWRDDAAQIVLVGDDGREVYHLVAEVARDKYGYAVDAATIGERYSRHADTPAQTAAKEIEMLVTGTHSLDEAAAVRKARALPFGGKLDPWKHIDDTQLPEFLPRRGTAHDLVSQRVELPPLSHVEAARLIKPRIESAGQEWSAQTFAWLQQRFAEGVPPDQVDQIVEELTGQQAGRKAVLRVVNAE
ncbi:MAG: integrase [Oxalobacter sp.]|nr:MAG: integrase [Oxalobacter sp.]